MNNTPASLWPVFLAVSLLTLASGMLHAAPTQQQWRTLNSAVVSQHVVPRYQAFMRASQTLQQRSQALCDSPREAQLQQAQQAFHRTMDAWQQIQHVQFGPIENLMRNFSIQFWPDKKNLTSKQLNRLLAQQDPATLQADYLRGASIAVKGLPALERLLFTPQGLAAFAAHSYHCQLTMAVSGHIAAIARGTAMEWQAYANNFATPGDGRSYYEDDQEAAIDLMKSLVEPLEVIRDLKVLRPLGETAGKVRPRRSESWRSQRSLRNIRLNIDSLHALYSGTGTATLARLLQQQGDAALSAAIEQQFAHVEQRLDSIPAPLSQQLNAPQTQQQLRLLAAELKALHQQLSTAMQQLNIQLGFNSRDGD